MRKWRVKWFAKVQSLVNGFERQYFFDPDYDWEEVAFFMGALADADYDKVSFTLGGDDDEEMNALFIDPLNSASIRQPFCL